MKKIFVLTMVLVGHLALAGEALDSPKRAIKVKDRLQKSVFQIEGVNGIGVTGCDPATGKASLDKDFVHCVSISTENEEAYDYVLGLYPTRTKVGGVFIVVENVGVITSEPRLGGGN
ncbi:MAG: hypothetical protein SGJ18_11740 [Pseudomonadota bacterium]|nr:hypothetical protein [Pseudomonadota bacterium]